MYKIKSFSADVEWIRIDGGSYPDWAKAYSKMEDFLNKSGHEIISCHFERWRSGELCTDSRLTAIILYKE